MKGLKSCPYCGGVANVLCDKNDESERPYYVGCNNDSCLGFSGLGWTYATQEEAVKAWNTRYEQTCTNLYCKGSELGEGGFRCSLCDAESEGDEPRYCPQCGARVVDGDAS